MAKQPNNQVVNGSFDRFKRQALDILTEVLDREHAAKTYGVVGVEIDLENGEPRFVRRMVNATHK